jgi:hypothetical protein
MDAPQSLLAIDDASSIGSDAGRSDADKARALVEKLSAAGRRSTAEMLHELRRAFPEASLAVRVRALAALRTS